MADGALDWDRGIAKGYLIIDLLLRLDCHLWSVFHGGPHGNGVAVEVCWVSGWCGRVDFIPCASKVSMALKCLQDCMNRNTHAFEVPAAKTAPPLFAP